MDTVEFDFPVGIPGFTGIHRFSLSIVDSGPLHYLTALCEGGPRFSVVDPIELLPSIGSYSVQIDEWAVDLLDLTDKDKARVFVTLNTTTPQVTANLLGPIVLNEERHLGCQVIVDGYPLRAPIAGALTCSS